MRRTMRAAAVCVLLLGGVAGWVSAEKGVALPCAEYVSTQIWDEPDTGHLIGTETITYTVQVSPGGVGAKITTTFEVGTYELASGGSVRLDCRDYSVFEL